MAGVGPEIARSVHSKVSNEVSQSPETRAALLDQICESLSGRAVVAYYTSFRHDVQIDDNDVSLLEDVIMRMDTKQGLTLIISSPGGQALASERMINICRHYSGGDFDVIVPKMAKSAATLVCFGSNKIHMSPTSELGPVDPQIFRQTDQGASFTPADLVVATYKKLLRAAVRCGGNIEPYLQQLAGYDATMIARIEREQELGKTIATRALQCSMFKGQSEKKILDSIKPFIDAGLTSSHGRPIFIDTAKECGLSVEPIDTGGELWPLLMEFHIRADLHVSQDACKLVEAQGHRFAVRAPQRRQ